MEPSSFSTRLTMVLHGAAMVCALLGTLALTAWFVPDLARMYAEAGLVLPAHFRLLIGASRFWWIFVILAGVLLFLLSRGASAERPARRELAASALTFVSVVFFVCYGLAVANEYARTVDLAASHLGELREKIAADSAKAAADTTAAR